MAESSQGETESGMKGDAAFATPVGSRNFRSDVYLNTNKQMLTQTVAVCGECRGVVSCEN